MPVLVVDRLEPVQVDEEHRHRVTAQRRRERVLHPAAVRQPGQRVVLGLVRQPLLERPVLRDVPGVDHHAVQGRVGHLVRGGEVEPAVVAGRRPYAALQAQHPGRVGEQRVQLLPHRRLVVRVHQLEDDVPGEHAGLEPEDRRRAGAREDHPALPVDHRDDVRRVLEQRLEPLVGATPLDLAAIAEHRDADHADQQHGEERDVHRLAAAVHRAVEGGLGLGTHVGVAAGQAADHDRDHFRAARPVLHEPGAGAAELGQDRRFRPAADQVGHAARGHRPGAVHHVGAVTAAGQLHGVLLQRGDRHLVEADQETHRVATGQDRHGHRGERDAVHRHHRGEADLGTGGELLAHRRPAGVVTGRQAGGAARVQDVALQVGEQHAVLEGRALGRGQHQQGMVRRVALGQRQRMVGQHLCQLLRGEQLELTGQGRVVGAQLGAVGAVHRVGGVQRRAVHHDGDPTGSRQQQQADHHRDPVPCPHRVPPHRW